MTKAEEALVRTTVVMPERLKKQAQIYAIQNNMSFASFVVDAIQTRLAEVRLKSKPKKEESA